MISKNSSKMPPFTSFVSASIFKNISNVGPQVALMTFP